MLSIFHGSNFAKSRELLLNQIAKSSAPPIFFDAKNLDQDQLNNLLSGSSLFANEEPLVINNFFSLPPPTVQKFTQVFNRSNRDIYLWQDKGLTPTQLGLFPHAKVFKTDTSRQVWQLLNAIRPGNFSQFSKLLDQVVGQEPPELLSYFLRQHLRKHLSERNLSAYLALIETDYLTRSGQSSVQPLSRIRQIFAALLL